MQMSTIAHVVGMELGLAGQNNLQAGQASSISESAVDLKETCLMPIVYETNEKVKVCA